jgi:hypothetical protein
MASQPRGVVNHDDGRNPFRRDVLPRHVCFALFPSCPTGNDWSIIVPLQVPVWRLLAILPHSGWTTPKPCRAASKRVGNADDRNHALQGQPFRKMPISRHHFAVLLAVMLSAWSLGGCGTINEKLADGAGDYVPQWLGGLPADAPPRPGTAKYDAYMKEQERKRLEPATKDEVTKSNTLTDPIH